MAALWNPAARESCPNARGDAANKIGGAMRRRCT
jgi:hypothetical protein